MSLTPPTFCTPDSLAFSMILFFTAQSDRKIPGLKVPTIAATIMEDATLYFLVIFTSHFVLEMTILFGRVNLTLSFSGLQPVTTNLCCSRNRSNFFRARKSSPNSLIRNNPYRAFCCCTQRHRRVSPTSGLRSLISNDRRSVSGIFL